MVLVQRSRSRNKQGRGQSLLKGSFFETLPNVTSTPPLFSKEHFCSRGTLLSILHIVTQRILSPGDAFAFVGICSGEIGGLTCLCANRPYRRGSCASLPATLWHWVHFSTEIFLPFLISPGLKLALQLPCAGKANAAAGCLALISGILKNFYYIYGGDIHSSSLEFRCCGPSDSKPWLCIRST